ncbi:hypothetical protein H0H81_003215 [Sphagnurus paluster]|uniref:Uncharacterized protein n=1 Tax=Sphagnurus paluster TaxID=117069 RepID=A0A9P7KPD9_9AGAR|nr:hypothetical protein H0H81_003215 [Sphagnurus paluster]
MKLIEEALRETPSPTQSRTSAPPSTPSGGSQKRLDDIRHALTPFKPSPVLEMETSSRRDNITVSQSSWGCSQAPGSSSIFNRPITSSRSTGNIEADDSDEEALWAASDLSQAPLNEPPSTIPYLPPTTQGVDSGSSGSSYWRTDDPENPFDDSIALSQVSNSTSASSPYVPAPTSSSNTGHSAESIASMISGLNSIPDYLRKLERRLVAADRANVAKAKRIATLEEEVQRLQEVNRRLENSLSVSKMREH